MPLLTGSDLELPRDPQQPMQAATKQYVDDNAVSFDAVQSLFDNFFTVVSPGYTQSMTPFYQWNDFSVGLSVENGALAATTFLAHPNVCFSGSGVALAVYVGAYVSRIGYCEGFFPTSAIASTPLDSLNSFFSIPRVSRLLRDGSVIVLTSRLINGYTAEIISLSNTITKTNTMSLSTACWYKDVVQSKTDTTKTIFLGCDSSGPAIYYSTNYGAQYKATLSG